MTFVGRLSVRVVSYLSYLVLAAATLTLLFSDVEWLFWLGVLGALFLGDRIIHLREGDRPIPEMPRRGRVNLTHYLSPQAFALIERAYDRSVLVRSNFHLELAHHLTGLGEVRDALRRLDIDLEGLKQKLEDLMGESRRSKSARSKNELTDDAAKLVLAAYPYAYDNGHRFIYPGDLFAALPQAGDETLERLFRTFSIEPTDLGLALLFGSALKHTGIMRRKTTSLGAILLDYQREKRHRVMNRAWTSRPTPTLDRYGLDLTDLARRRLVGFLVGHEAEYKRLLETLSRPENPNVLLVGDAGVGKHTVIEHLALQIVKDRVPAQLFDKRLVSLDVPGLVAGAQSEELQARFSRIVEEILLAGNIILYIPEIHNLVRTSGTAYLSAADALMPIVKSNAFPVIGTTYPREFKDMLEPRSDFLGLFEVIRVDELSEEKAMKLLIYESILLEQKSRILVTFGAVKTAVKVAKKYLRDKPLPASASELLKGALVAVERKGEQVLGPRDVIASAEEKTNIPLHEALAGEAAHLLNLEAMIHERLVNQEEAVTAVARALREYRSGLARPGGPIASFLFVGPTGVGKTELAKVLARIHFGAEKSMIRFDMTEYQDKASLHRFIGMPHGAVSGALTEAVRQKPYSLILLDEFEKAHPDILNLFLQVFDDGRLTDSLGRIVDFTNTILIATSNAQANLIHESLRKGETMTQIAEYLRQRLIEVFRPELLNRFTKIVIFRDLAPKEVEKIAELNLKDLSSAVSNQGITLTFDPRAARTVARMGYDPASGARPLRRVIDEHVKALLSEKILRKEIGRGSEIRLTEENGAFSFVSAESDR